MILISSFNALAIEQSVRISEYIRDFDSVRMDNLFNPADLIFIQCVNRLMHAVKAVTLTH